MGRGSRRPRPALLSSIPLTEILPVSAGLCLDPSRHDHGMLTAPKRAGLSSDSSAYSNILPSLELTPLLFWSPTGPRFQPCMSGLLSNPMPICPNYIFVNYLVLR